LSDTRIPISLALVERYNIVFYAYSIIVLSI
jgi:hypothetical protein